MCVRIVYIRADSPSTVSIYIFRYTYILYRVSSISRGYNAMRARAGRKCPGFSDPSVGGGNFLSLLWKETVAGGGVGLPLLEILLSSPLYCALLSFDLALSFFFASAVYSRASFLIPLCKVRLRGKGDWVCCLSRFFSLAFFLLGLGTFATRERERQREVSSFVTVITVGWDVFLFRKFFAICDICGLRSNGEIWDFIIYTEFTCDFKCSVFLVIIVQNYSIVIV